MLLVALTTAMNCSVLLLGGEIVVGEKFTRENLNRNNMKGRNGENIEFNVKIIRRVLIVRQNCINWFILQAFRVIATLPLSIFSVLPTKFTPTDVQETARLMARTDTEWFDPWMQSWFSRKRSKEAMMRGIRNESAVLAYLEKNTIFRGIRDVELVSDLFK